MRNSVWPNVLKMKLLFTTNKSNLILFHKFNKIFKKTIDWLDWRKCESLEVLIIIGDHNFFMSERIVGVFRENDGGSLMKSLGSPEKIWGSWKESFETPMKIWWSLMKIWGSLGKLLGVSTKKKIGFFLMKSLRSPMNIWISPMRWPSKSPIII